MASHCLLRGECRDRVVVLLGREDPVVALLLSQIVYWCLPGKTGHTKLRVRRAGHYWIAKSREAWMAETGLSLEQYKRAITVLRRHQMVEWRQMIFAGKPISHVRLLQPLAGFTPPKLTNTAPWSQSHHAVHSPPVQCSTNTNNISCTSEAKAFAMIGVEIQKEDSGGDEEKSKKSMVLPSKSMSLPTPLTSGQKFAHTNSSALSGALQTLPPKAWYIKSTLGSPSTPQPIGWLMKASEVLNKQFQQGKIGSLSGFWQSRMQLLTGKFQYPLTGKEQGQLKNLQKALGVKARPVIDYALDHWAAFASQAAQNAGTDWPGMPHIGFLLMHYDVAVNLLDESVAKPAPLPTPVMVPSMPLQSSASKPTLVDPDDLPAPKLSVSELAALLKDYQSP